MLDYSVSPFQSIFFSLTEELTGPPPLIYLRSSAFPCPFKTTVLLFLVIIYHFLIWSSTRSWVVCHRVCYGLHQDRSLLNSYWRINDLWWQISKVQIKKAVKKVCPKVAPFYPEDKSLQTQMTRECNFLIRIFS